jgi:hypothetical protein
VSSLSPIWQFEVHADDGCDFDGMAVDQIRAVAPVTYGIGCRAAQQPVTFDDVHVFDRPLPRDDGLHDDCTLHAGETGEFGI